MIMSYFVSWMDIYLFIKIKTLYYYELNLGYLIEIVALVLLNIILYPLALKSGRS